MSLRWNLTLLLLSALVVACASASYAVVPREPQPENPDGDVCFMTSEAMYEAFLDCFANDGSTVASCCRKVHGHLNELPPDVQEP